MGRQGYGDEAAMNSSGDDNDLFKNAPVGDLRSDLRGDMHLMSALLKQMKVNTALAGALVGLAETGSVSVKDLRSVTNALDELAKVTDTLSDSIDRLTARLAGPMNG